MKFPEFPPLVVALDRVASEFNHHCDDDEKAFYNDCVNAAALYGDARSGKNPKPELLKKAYDDLLREVRRINTDTDKNRLEEFKNFVHAFGRFMTHYKDGLESEHNMKTQATTAAAAKTHKHTASGKKFFEVEFGHGGTFLDGVSVDGVGKNFAKKMDCEVRPAKMTPGGLVGVGKFKKFKHTVAKTKSKTSKSPYMSHASTVVASEKVWVAKSPKGGNVTDPVASKALEKYMEAFGKRGNLSLYEAERDNGMLRFTSGCKMFKGTLKEIIARLQAEAIATASSFVNIPKEAQSTAKAIRTACVKAGLGSVVVAYDKNGPEWRITVKKPNSLGMDVAYMYLVSSYGTTPDDREVSIVIPNKTVVLFDGSVGSLPDSKRDLGKLLLSYVTLAAHAIKRMSKEASASVVIAEEVTVPNKVAGQIYGDIKAISSKLKSWKKSMTPDEYKLYESYQKSVLKAVMAEWVPKLSKEYQEKIKSI